MTVAGLLLAAGAGRRMGGPKALLELDGEALVQRGIRLLHDGGCAPVVVVVGAAAEQVLQLCAGAQVVPYRSPSTTSGAALSPLRLRRGMEWQSMSSAMPKAEAASLSSFCNAS